MNFHVFTLNCSVAEPSGAASFNVAAEAKPITGSGCIVGESKMNNFVLVLKNEFSLIKYMIQKRSIIAL